MIVVLLIVFYIYNKLQLFYRNSSRELKRLDSVYKSPLYSLLSECIANGPSIRANRMCNAESSGKSSDSTMNAVPTMTHFNAVFTEALDSSLCVSLNTIVAAQWLGIRLQLLGIFTTLSIIVLSILSVVYNIFPMSPGLVGLSLLYSMNVVNTLSGVINSITEAEQSMISVERVHEYIAILDDEFSCDNKDGRDPRLSSNSNTVDDLDDVENTSLTDALLKANTEHLKDKEVDGDTYYKFNITDRSSMDIASYRARFSHMSSGAGDKFVDMFPTAGSIQFKDVTVQYCGYDGEHRSAGSEALTSDLDEQGTDESTRGGDRDSRLLYNNIALFNVSFSIPAGARVAIVGRSGTNYQLTTH